jgi:hypothetical protein
MLIDFIGRLLEAIIIVAIGGALYFGAPFVGMWVYKKLGGTFNDYRK